MIRIWCRAAGLVPVMRLAERAVCTASSRERLHVPTDKGANASGKVATIVAGMVDRRGLDRRSGRASATAGWARCSAACTRPSTLGSFLRAFTHGHVRQLQAAVPRVPGPARPAQAPLLPGAGAVTFVDVDSLLRRVYGKKKQGVGFGHAKVGGYKVLLRGYNPLVATISTPDAAPVIAATQLRAGNAGSARGAASLVAEAIATTKAVLRRPAQTGRARSWCGPTRRSTPAR